MKPKDIEEGMGNVQTTAPTSLASLWKRLILISTVMLHIVQTHKFQDLLDKLNPHILHRWIALSFLAFIYVVRVYLVQGFYLVSFALGTYLLYLFIEFLSPKQDPFIQAVRDYLDGATLPTRASDEFCPFVRSLPEFIFWYSSTRAFCIAFVMTFFGVFDVPVFGPSLLIYLLVWVIIAMRNQINQMIKYKYVPFSYGKKLYGQRDKAAAEENTSLI